MVASLIVKLSTITWFSTPSMPARNTTYARIKAIHRFKSSTVLSLRTYLENEKYKQRQPHMYNTTVITP